VVDRNNRNECPDFALRPWFVALSGGALIRKTSMRHLTRPLAATVLTAAWLLSVPLANAQVHAPSPAPSQQTESIPDAKLDAAAAALEQVARIKENYQGQLEAASPSDKPRIAAQAKDALEGAVTGQGLSVDEYDSILTVAQNNADVRDKILQRVRPPAK
jgi:hypothetical protein